MIKIFKVTALFLSLFFICSCATGQALAVHKKVMPKYDIIEKMLNVYAENNGDIFICFSGKMADTDEASAFTVKTNIIQDKWSKESLTRHDIAMRQIPRKDIQLGCRYQKSNIQITDFHFNKEVFRYYGRLMEVLPNEKNTFDDTLLDAKLGEKRIIWARIFTPNTLTEGFAIYSKDRKDYYWLNIGTNPLIVPKNTWENTKDIFEVIPLIAFDIVTLPIQLLFFIVVVALNMSL